MDFYSNEGTTMPETKATARTEQIKDYYAFRENIFRVRLKLSGLMSGIL